MKRSTKTIITFALLSAALFVVIAVPGGAALAAVITAAVLCFSSPVLIATVKDLREQERLEAQRIGHQKGRS